MIREIGGNTICYRAGTYRQQGSILHFTAFLHYSAAAALGLPMVISDEVQKTYDLIESLPSGSRVVVSFDLSPGGYDELAPATVAVFNHMAMKGIRMVGMSFWDAGPSLLDRSLAGHCMRTRNTELIM